MLEIDALALRPLALEEVLWKPREDTPGYEWNGFRSLWTSTDAPDKTHLRQTAGINPVARLKSGAGKKRVPAIAIFLSSSGERQLLPWLDEIDLDNGFVRYFGDNRPSRHVPAEGAAGNANLLREMEHYSASTHVERHRAAPLLFFKNLGTSEGEPLTQFLGFGLIRAAHRLTQLYKGSTFSNYAYDCILFHGDEASDGEELIDVRWIDARRDPSLSDDHANALAPRSWQKWILQGSEYLETRGVRRYVDRAHSWSNDEQLPEQQSSLGQTLEAIYRRFEDNNSKHGFQALAALTSERVLREAGLNFHRGWVTPVGPDGGVDFVQRLDVGWGMARVPLVVLGQAKCKKPWSSNSGINAEDVARVVARLRRGWIGCYATTSYFTPSAQRELVVDEYPVALIAGRQLAEAAEGVRDEEGLPTIGHLLDWLEEVEYPRLLAAARTRPSDILREWPGRPDETARNGAGR